MAKRERRTDNKNGEIAHMNEINVIIHKWFINFYLT
jgi:hypothetical protein